MATYDGPILDAFTHFLPPEYMEQVIRRSTNRDLAKRLTAIPMLSDLERRLAMMERWPRYAQVLTLSQPSADSVCGPDEAPALARLGNDGLAAVVAQHRDRFPAFVASLPLNNLAAAVEEFDRAVRQCGAAGVQIDTNVQGVPLDDPRFFPLFEKAVELDVPIWLHPYRGSRPADYPGEAKSKYEIWQVLGWPYETSVAMARLVFSGVLKRLPTLKIITHHLGAMIPFFEGRIGALWDQLGTRSADEDLSHVREMLGRRPVEYFRMFYGDTAIGSSPAAIRCGLEFFGDDQVVFASDCPFDPEGGTGFIRDGIAAIDQLDLPPATQQKIFYGNSARLLKIGRTAAPQETNHA